MKKSPSPFHEFYAVGVGSAVLGAIWIPGVLGRDPFFNEYLGGCCIFMMLYYAAKFAIWTTHGGKSNEDA